MDLNSLTSGQLKILAYEQLKLKETAIANLQVIEPLIAQKQEEERAITEAEKTNKQD